MEVFRNFAESTLSSPYTAASGIIEITDDALFPDDGAFYVVLGNPERTIFHVTESSPPRFGVAVENDANADAGATVKLIMTAQTMDEIKKDQVTKSTFFEFANGVFPAKEGRLHLFTDSPHVGRQVSSIATPDLWYGLFLAGKINPGNFFALNTGTSVFTTTDMGGAPRWRTAVEAVPEGVHGGYLSVPSGAFERIVGLVPDPTYADGGLPAERPARAGIFAMESVTGKIITLGCKFDAATGVRLAEVAYWDDQDTINSVAFLGRRYHYLPSPLWYRIERAGSNLVYSASTNRYSLTGDNDVVLNEAITAFFTTEPDRVGFFIENELIDEIFSATFVSWEAVG